MSAEELHQFAAVIEQRIGLRVSDRLSAIADIVARRAARHHEPTIAYLRRLDTGDPDELNALTSEVSVGETYFFRHAEQCHAFGALLGGRNAPVRVLSAGCSTGDEPYTLAMIARERQVPVVVHAFDFNAAALARAAVGRYSRWAVRALPPELERNYFSPGRDGRELVLAESIRSAVTFSQASLHEDGPWLHGHWDVVFCRNVLMYFSEERMRRALERLSRALAPGGYLFLGHAETLQGRMREELELCHTHNTFYYRKVGAAPAVEPVADWTAEIAAATRRVHAIVDGARVGSALVPAEPAPVAEVVARPLVPIRALIVDERFGEAFAALAALPSAVARGGDAQLLAAVALAQTGKLADAEALCGELLARGEQLAAAHYLRSVCTGSAAAADAALAVDPTFAMASVQLAFLAKRAGDRAAHAAALARAIALLEAEDPDRLALFSGGFKKSALLDLCRTELARSAP